MRFCIILFIIALVASQSCNIDIQNEYQVGDDIDIHVSCTFIPSQFTVYPPLIGFEVNYPTIKGKAILPMPPTKYQVRIGNGDEVITVVITLNIVKAFCRYGVGREFHLHNEVYYRISAPECNVAVTRIWAENLPSGLSINNNDGSIEGVVNENSEKVATIFVNHAYNNQTLTFKTSNGGYNIIDESTCKKLKPVTFIYNTKSLVLKAGVAMNNMLPTISSISKFLVEPELPSGITLNPSTGLISGTPEEMQDNKQYVFYAEDEWKNKFEMSIRVVDKTCPERDGFSETTVGSFGEIPCRNGNDGYERRKCNEDQTWDETIDDSECLNAKPELVYPDKLYSFFVNVSIDPIMYEKSVGIIAYIADDLPSGLSINEFGTISGTPTAESSRTDYKITGVTRKSEIIETYISIFIEGSYCKTNGGFNNAAAGETAFIPCTSSTTWGVSSRYCKGPEETGTDQAEWEPAIECKKVEAPFGRKEYQFSLNITNIQSDLVSIGRFNAVYNAVYELLSYPFEADISSLMYVAVITSDNKLAYNFYIFSATEEQEVKDIITQMIVAEQIKPKLLEKDYSFFSQTEIVIDREVEMVNYHTSEENPTTIIPTTKNPTPNPTSTQFPTTPKPTTVKPTTPKPIEKIGIEITISNIASSTIIYELSEDDKNIIKDSIIQIYHEKEIELKREDIEVVISNDNQKLRRLANEMKIEAIIKVPEDIPKGTIEDVAEKLKGSDRLSNEIKIQSDKLEQTTIFKDAKFEVTNVENKTIYPTKPNNDGNKDDNKDDEGISTTMLIAIIAGLVVVVIILTVAIVGILLCRCRKTESHPSVRQ